MEAGAQACSDPRMASRSKIGLAAGPAAAWEVRYSLSLRHSALLQGPSGLGELAGVVVGARGVPCCRWVDEDVPESPRWAERAPEREGEARKLREERRAVIPHAV